MTIQTAIKQIKAGNHLEPQEAEQAIKELEQLIKQARTYIPDYGYTSEILRDTWRTVPTSNIDHIRQMVYGSESSELVGMQLFIDSRQAWCKEEILRKMGVYNQLQDEDE